jgi:hypothetical protein
VPKWSSLPLRTLRNPFSSLSAILAIYRNE